MKVQIYYIYLIVIYMKYSANLRTYFILKFYYLKLQLNFLRIFN